MTPKPCLLKSFPWAQKKSRTWTLVVRHTPLPLCGCWFGHKKLVFSWGTGGCFPGIFLCCNGKEMLRVSLTIQIAVLDLRFTVSYRPHPVRLDQVNSALHMAHPCFVFFLIILIEGFTPHKPPKRIAQGTWQLYSLLLQWCTVGLLTYVKPQKMTSPFLYSLTQIPTIHHISCCKHWMATLYLQYSITTARSTEGQGIKQEERSQRVKWL